MASSRAGSILKRHADDVAERRAVVATAAVPGFAVAEVILANHCASAFHCMISRTGIEGDGEMQRPRLIFRIQPFEQRVKVIPGCFCRLCLYAGLICHNQPTRCQ
jgi:hypothetical protein